jgi:tuberous sclerosis 2
MSRDVDTTFKPRPRANTASVPSFWRKTKAEPVVAASQPTAVAQDLSVDEYIEALTPPTVPKLSYARSLSNALLNCSPLPNVELLMAVLTALCAKDSPPSVQAAGYDVLAAYCENDEAFPLQLKHRQDLFSVFRDTSHPWNAEIWEPKFKALRSLTNHGKELVGIEVEFTGVCQAWISDALDNLLVKDDIEQGERMERERCISMVAGYLSSVLEKGEVASRFSDDSLLRVLHFYADLVDKAMSCSPSDNRPAWTPLSDASMSPTNTPTRPSYLIHRRHPSSTSINSIPSPTTTTSASHSLPSSYATKPPTDITIALYLAHVKSQMKYLTPNHLDKIMPLLFRALFSCASPLPRLSLLSPPKSKIATSEDHIYDMLNGFFSGNYSSVSMMILKQHLYPPKDLASNAEGTPSLVLDGASKLAVKTAFGAQRTLRNYIRRALQPRLARSYISKESSVSYSPSGAPGHIDVDDVEKELLERAWGKDEVGLGGWHPGRLGGILAGSVQAWVKFAHTTSTEATTFVSLEGERILEEATGTLRDILQELDARDEDHIELEDTEATAIGETILRFSEYVNPLRSALLFSSPLESHQL